ncbi:MAG: hypothetical protein MJ147_02360 [Clostridia bacterium]|nr:hypothetical protein [Clostridia bacterium]
MIQPLQMPNLPQSRVRHVAVSDFSELLLSKLSELKIEPIITINSANLDEKINYHTDMLMLNLSKGVILADKSQKDNFVKLLTIGYKYSEFNSQIKSPYPNDSLLNVVFMGDKLICNPKTIDNSIISYAKQADIKIIPVNQGYTKCSVCVLNDNAIITDDESIHTACENFKIDSLLISKGSVKLKGFNYGFIGGCTGLIDKNKLLFNGDINCHKDCNKMLDFLKKHCIKPVIIENQPLCDIGSIIPLTEEI